MKKVKRKYESAHRKLLAGQTRGQILESARRLFRDRGYGRVTIEEIAADAGVAVPTVYATYGGKRAILLHLLDEMEKAADVSALLAALRDCAGDERAQLRAFVDFSVRLFSEGGDLIRIAELAGAADPDVAALWQTGGARRLQACRSVLSGWERRGLLRGGLTESRAIDILWCLCGAEFYGLFVRECRWTPQQFGEWLYALASEQLLATPGRRVRPKL
jgi:AcrR family transcriptional regulator